MRKHSKERTQKTENIFGESYSTFSSKGKILCLYQVKISSLVSKNGTGIKCYYLVYYMMEQSFFFFFPPVIAASITIRMASSITLRKPVPSFAEHSTYPAKFNSLTMSSTCCRDTCHSNPCLPLKSLFVPTSKIGVLGQWCRTSTSHRSFTLINDGWFTTENMRTNKSVFGYASVLILAYPSSPAVSQKAVPATKSFEMMSVSVLSKTVGTYPTGKSPSSSAIQQLETQLFIRFVAVY